MTSPVTILCLSTVYLGSYLARVLTQPMHVPITGGAPQRTRSGLSTVYLGSYLARVLTQPMHVPVSVRGIVRTRSGLSTVYLGS